MKIGIEVEGRFKGLKTLFINESETVQVTKELLDQVQQIYISDLENVLELGKLVYVNPNVKPLLVTVERTEVPNSRCDDINIVLRIENQSFWRLNGTDQIKFENGHHVFTAVTEDMTRTEPWEFDKDVTL